MRRIILALALVGCGSSSTSPSDPLDPSLRPEVDTDPSHYPANVWVTDGMVKVQPDATPGDVKWAFVWAARNETESFQVHVQGPAELDVTVTGLDGITARVSREAYLDITTPSDANGVTGLVPDALIPAVDAYVGETRNAFPVTVPAGETRSAWIDLFVPEDTASGWYQGTIHVNGAELPVVLAVWDFALPSTATLASGFGMSWNGLCVQAYGSYEACGAYPGSGGDPDTAVELTHIAEATALLDYRISVAQAVYAPPTPGDWTHFDAVYGPLMDGTADTQLRGAQLTHLWYTGGLDDTALLADWTAHFEQKGWLDRTSAYYCDEPPNGCSFDEVRAIADTIAGAAPDLPKLLTTDLEEAAAEDLLDRVDIMVAIVESMEGRDFPSVRPSYDDFIAAGNTLWWYQSCDEHESCSNGNPGPATATWPSYMVDATPVRNRVFQWLAYLYDVEGELYYDSDYCWDSDCGGQNDPWVSQYAFGGNGDGTLFYPGTPAKIGGTTPVPVASIRLALIRDGMEDYELLHALGGAAARDIAGTFITNNYTFDNDPTALTAARQQLGDALHGMVHPP